MSAWIVVGLVIVCAARDAAAERAVVVDAVGVPFQASELAAAIRVRIPAEGAPVQVRIIATARGVRIEAPRGAREVELVGLHGAAAVRVIALSAGDLLLDPLAIVPPAARRLTGAHDVTLGLLGAVAGWDGLLGDVAADLTLPRAGWFVAVELGGGRLIDSTLHLTAAVVRLDAGARLGVFEARAGITAAPLIVTSGVGDQTVLVGGNVSVRVRLPVVSTMRVIAAAGCDGFATRTEYRMAGIPTLTTPWFAPWLAAGVEVGL